MSESESQEHSIHGLHMGRFKYCTTGSSTVVNNRLMSLTDARSGNTASATTVYVPECLTSCVYIRFGIAHGRWAIRVFIAILGTVHVAAPVFGNER